MSELTFHRINSDADRDRVRAFFDANMKDQTGWRVLSRAEDRALRIPSVIQTVEDPHGHLVAASYASANPEDVIRWREQGLFKTADIMADEVLMLHQITVAPAYRRSGIGTTLVRQLVDDALGAGCSVIALAFDDTTPGLADFYTRTGFDLLARAETLDLSLPGHQGVYRLPQNDRTYRWAFRILHSRTTVLSS